METLAYLHLAQVYEEPTRTSINLDGDFHSLQGFQFFQELKWSNFSSSLFIQFLGIALALAVLEVAQAEVTQSNIYPGSKGDSVSQIQKQLRDRGYFNGNITGYYGDKTKNAVIKFQRDSGLQADGIVGAATQGALHLAKDETLSSPQSTNEVPPPQPISDTSPSPQPPPSLTSFTIPVKLKQPNSDLTYNVKTPPAFRQSQKLQAIINEVVALAKSQRLPTDPLSITLIDVNTGEIAGYQQNQLRFPASVIKLFWLVELYAQIEQGIWEENDFKDFIDKMISQSDNDAASLVLDAISNTQSGSNLSGQDYKAWLGKRQKVNNFFQAAGYEGININQKVFPIEYLSINEPQGRELLMRGNPYRPIYNRITTYHAARLLYEIFTGQAVSQSASNKMLNWLTIDSATKAAQKNNKNSENFNPVQGFLSEDLPDTVNFAGKAGGNSTSRHEVALIKSNDGKVTYILAIFAAHRAYADNGNIFPKMSQQVLERMVARSKN